MQLASAADLVPVLSRRLDRTLSLPGEIRPFQRVAIYARVPGFVDQVRVDAGSPVKKGDLLATLVAPELTKQRLEGEAKVQAIVAQRAEAEAKVVAARSTHERLKAASVTPGVIAGNELIQAEKAVDAAQAHVQALEGAAKAARAAVDVLKDMEAYLQVAAPFDGVITERGVHPGALAGPNSSTPMFQLEQNSRLRLVVSVPEASVAGISPGAKVSFTAPAYPGEHFSGTIARNPRSMDAKTRSMAVELDVANPGGLLAPGMYPTVAWPVRRPGPSLLAPPSSVVTTTERTFVIRVKDGVAQWVNVAKGAPAGDLVEVFSPALREGDQILRRASDEIREGTQVK